MFSFPFGRDLERDASPRDRRCALLAIALVTESRFLATSHQLMGAFDPAFRLTKTRVVATWRVSYSLDRRLVANLQAKWGHDSKSALKHVAFWVRGQLVREEELGQAVRIVEAIHGDFGRRARATS